MNEGFERFFVNNSFSAVTSVTSALEIFRRGALYESTYLLTDQLVSAANYALSG